MVKLQTPGLDNCLKFVLSVNLFKRNGLVCREDISRDIDRLESVYLAANGEHHIVAPMQTYHPTPSDLAPILAAVDTVLSSEVKDVMDKDIFDPLCGLLVDFIQVSISLRCGYVDLRLCV